MVVRSLGWGTRPQFPSWLHHSLLCEPTQGASRPRACLSLRGEERSFLRAVVKMFS